MRIKLNDLNKFFAQVFLGALVGILTFAGIAFLVLYVAAGMAK